MKQLVNNEADLTRHLFGDESVSFGDYAMLDERTNVDAVILAHLDEVLPGETSQEKTPILSDVAFEAAGGYTPMQLDLAKGGLFMLKKFHEAVVGPTESAFILTVGDLSPWTWADTAMTALVLFTTGHWEKRLHRIYGPRITSLMRERLAEYWHKSLAASHLTEHLATREEPLLATFLYQLLLWPLKEKDLNARLLSTAHTTGPVLLLPEGRQDEVKA